MTATESRKSPVSRKSMVGQALFVIVLLLIVCYFWMRDQPERLMNAPSYTYKVSGDYLYRQCAPDALDTPFPGQPAIQAQSIRGGALRTIAQEDTRYQFNNGGGNVLDDLRGTAGEIYYVMEARTLPLKAPPRTAPSRATASSAPPKVTAAPAPSRATASSAPPKVTAAPAPPAENLGTFLLPPKGAPDGNTAGQKRLYSDLSSYPINDIRIRQVTSQGGVPRDAVTFKDYGYALVGDHLFWIRLGRWAWVDVMQDNGSGHRTRWTEEAADSDLMLTSLADGATRCIYHGIPHTHLNAGEAGITWEQPAPFPTPPSVFYARVSDGSVRALGALQKNEYASPPVEAQGHLYWVARFDQGGSYRVLMSANRDGAGAREVCRQVNRHPIAYLTLHAYQGNLYGSVVEQRTAGDGAGKQKQYVCRFHPERSDPVEIVHKLPDAVSQAQFDGDYLYFVRGETKRSLWAVLTNDDAGAEVTTSLYRVSLDH